MNRVQPTVPHMGDNMRKLSIDDVRAIKEALSEGEHPRDIAARFHISANYVREIRRGVHYGWVQL